MSRSQFILILLIILVALLLPYGLKSAAPERGKIEPVSEQAYQNPEG
ncbi:MAG TPA: hypothetical protein VMT04_06675 [Terriglobales bacterium]|nr:hypothetical protein [Terriglobales bacterium]